MNWQFYLIEKLTIRRIVCLIKMNAIFVAYTPYHICIALGLARLQHESAKNYLIVINNFCYADLYKSVIEESLDNPFYMISIFPGITRRGSLTYMKQVLFSIYNKWQINTLFKKIVDTQTVMYTFNDYYFESQYLQHLVYNEGGKVICVEDGSAFYRNSTLKCRSTAEIQLLRLILGRCYQSVQVLGTYKYSLELMALYPEHLRKELQCKNVYILPHDVFSAIKDVEVGNNILLRCNYKIPEKIDCLVLLPHSTELNDAGSRNIYTDIIWQLSREGYNVAVKLHPREENFAIISLFRDRIYVIPNFLAAEILYNMVENNPPKYIIGDSSTSLITARIILKKVPIISVVHLMGGIIREDDPLIHLFGCINILLPETVNELYGMLAGN